MTGDVLIQIAYGCPSMHINSMWVCEECAEWWSEAAHSNEIQCPDCSHKCIEFLARRDGSDDLMAGIAMTGDGAEFTWAYNPNITGCRHPVITAGTCDTCGAAIPAPQCAHNGAFTPMYTLDKGTPAFVICRQCNAHLTLYEAARVCTHNFLPELSGDPNFQVTRIRCQSCGLAFDKTAA